MKVDKQDPKVQRRITVLTVLLVILAGIVSSCIQGGSQDAGYLQFYNDGYLRIRDHTGMTTDYWYTDMTDVVYVEAMEAGTPVDGAVLEEIRLGIWYSHTYGEYQACIREDIGACIFVRTEQGAFAINYESEESTRALYSAILKARQTLAS